MYDMCNDNQVTDVETINQPATIMNSKADQENQRRAELRKRWSEKKKTEGRVDETRQMGSSPLLSYDDTEDQIQTPRSVKGTQEKTFVYAAILPPGLHQFLIYCPKTKRAFCK